MKKTLLVLLCVLGFAAVAQGFDDVTLRLSPIAERCARATCPDNTDTCFKACEEKVKNAHAYGQKIGMDFLQVMDDCLDFTCQTGSQEDLKCINEKIDAFLQLKKGDPAPCYGGG